ncbi:unnamed protein product [Moneuplotes crassus]|uniref:Uncharacterized protein n=1 Tax=Euplotes crassus TaxID=5936 RepID=A0AAD2D5F1_EUPCR|nr:unnamed protein product [Moneuplotes crassus]
MSVPFQCGAGDCKRVQQGKVDQIESEIIQASEMYTVEVQEDIFDQTQRISEFLTHTKQIDENLVHSFSNEYLDGCEKMTNFVMMQNMEIPQ